MRGCEPSVRRPSVCLEKSESCRSCPNEQHSRSAIYGLVSPREFGGVPHLEHVEDDVELERLLASHRVVHLACIGRLGKEHHRRDEDRDFDQIALVREAQVPTVTARTEEVRERVAHEVEQCRE